MKKFLAVVLLLAVAAALFRNSLYFSAWQLSSAVNAGDLAGVEARADLEAFASLPVDLAVASAQTSADDASGSAAGSLVGALGAALGGLINVAAKPLALIELRSRIEKRELKQLLGPFQVNDLWFGGTQSLDGSTIVQIKGTCVDKKNPKARIDTSLGLVMTKVSGPYLGFPIDYRATGVESASLRALARQCDIGAKP